jgi:hypothetical protein
MSEHLSMGNRSKQPHEWDSDIDRTVVEYDKWYLAKSPGMFAEARGRAVVDVEIAMQTTKDFRTFNADAFSAHPEILFVARMCVSPTMARDRFVGFSGVNKSLVTTMERDGFVSPGTRRLRMQLDMMCAFLRPLLDPGLFPWVREDRAPVPAERDKAILVVSDRLANAFYGPVLRNAQEARQKGLLRAYLQNAGFQESRRPALDMPAGTFGFGRNVRVVREDGNPQNLPVDCVVVPLDADLPLACVELKSAGDYANVNKRRKEESDKANALKRAHGDKAVFLLQLFGYFNRSYLSFEAAAGIDWAWDHRLSDLSPYFGLE